MKEYIEERLEKLRRFLFRRRLAYQNVFSETNPHAETVLTDLAKFCRANDSTFEVDARAHAVREGRREVFLRIAKHLKMDSSQFLEFYGKGRIDVE